MNTVSTKQLREDMSSVKARLARGETLVWLDRSKVLAEIHPHKKEPQAKARVSSDEKLIQMRKLAGGFNFGSKKSLSPDELNELFEKSYDDVLPRR